jgi:hypothetical protein
MPVARRDTGERRTAGRPGEAEPWTSVRRDAWRIQLFHDQVAEESKLRHRAGAMRMAVLVGLAVGLFGCGVSLFL